MFFSLKDSRYGIYISGFTLVLLWGLITWLSTGIAFEWLPLSWQTGFVYELSNDQMPTSSFLALHFLCWIVLCYALKKVKASGEMRGLTVNVVIGISILLRIIAVFGEPIHENDFYRYLWDGQVSLAGENPFAFAPGEVEKSPALMKLQESNPEFHRRIGHPSIPTIYPPVAQAVFALSSACFGWSVPGLKAIILCFDMGIVLLLIGILRRTGSNAGWAILYAWNPLVIKEFANSAHYDSIPVFFCLLALWFALGKSGAMKRSVEIGMALALGTLAKYFAIILLPVLLIAVAREKSRGVLWRSPEIWIGGAVFISLVLAGFIPFFLWNEVGVKGVFEGLTTYLENWQYSPGVFALVERAIAYGSGELHLVFAKDLLALIFVVVVVVISLRPTRNAQHLAVKCFCVISALFVLSPTAFPWYFCWVLAFAVFAPGFSWLLLGGLLPLNYLDFHSATDIPIAHAQWMGFYLVPSLIWLIFAMAWFSERRWSKSG